MGETPVEVVHVVERLLVTVARVGKGRGAGLTLLHPLTSFLRGAASQQE